MTTAHVPVRPLACRAQCVAADEHPVHHARLLAVDTDVDALLDLLEMAVTWRELDWSEAPVIGPRDWPAFAAAHRWRDPARAARVFSLAADIVGRDVAGPAASPQPAALIELVRS